MSSLEEAKREAQKEVAECEKEIGAIKATVKSLAASPGTSQQQQQQQQQQQDQETADSLSSSSAAAAAADAGNSLTVVLLKVEGLTDADESKEEEEEQKAVKACKLRLSLQLSSPIEEGVLSEIFDPELQDVPETMKVTFRGVETNQATLTLTATTDVSSSNTTQAPLLIGTSESLDLSFITKLDAMNPKKEYVTDLPVVIYPEAKKAEGDEQATTTSTPPVAASCTVTIRLTFVPSQKDLLEELYELLNKATTRKTRAVDKLKQIAVMAARQSAAQQMTMANRQQQQQHQPAVRAGFLNKTAAGASALPKPKEQPSKLQVFYDRYLGPQTLWRQLLPLAKNYIIFFVAVSAMHFKGHNLALPPPV